MQSYFQSRAHAPFVPIFCNSTNNKPKDFQTWTLKFHLQPRPPSTEWSIQQRLGLHIDTCQMFFVQNNYNAPSCLTTAGQTADGDPLISHQSIGMLLRHVSLILNNNYLDWIQPSSASSITTAEQRKICDAVEVAGRNVMHTSSVVTTGVVSHRYGEQAGEITNEGMSAAGHAFGTAWAVFKIRKALNPKGVMKPTTLVKSAANAAAADLKAKKGKK